MPPPEGAHCAGLDDCTHPVDICPTPQEFEASAPPDAIWVAALPGAQGEGLRNRPFGDIPVALDAAEPGDTVMLLDGHHPGPVTIPAGVSVRGRCAASTRVIGTVAFTGAGGSIEDIRVDGAEVHAPVRALEDAEGRLERVEVVGGQAVAIAVQDGGRLELNGVRVRDVEGIGIAVAGGMVESRRLEVRNVKRAGLFVEAGGTLSLDRVQIVGVDSVVLDTGILVTDRSQVRLSRSEIHTPNATGLSVRGEEADALLDSVVISAAERLDDGSVATGLLAHGSASATARDIVFRRWRKAAAQVQEGARLDLQRVVLTEANTTNRRDLQGLSAVAGGRLNVSQADIADHPAVALFADDPGSRLEARDVASSRTGGVGTPAVLASSRGWLTLIDSGLIETRWGAVFAAGAGTGVEVVGCLLAAHRSSGLLNGEPAALQVQENAEMRLRRVDVHQPGADAVARLRAAALDIEGLRVRGSSNSPSAIYSDGPGRVILSDGLLEGFTDSAVVDWDGDTLEVGRVAVCDSLIALDPTGTGRVGIEDTLVDGTRYSGVLLEGRRASVRNLRLSNCADRFLPDGLSAALLIAEPVEPGAEPIDVTLAHVDIISPRQHGLLLRDGARVSGQAVAVRDGAQAGFVGQSSGLIVLDDDTSLKLDDVFIEGMADMALSLEAGRLAGRRWTALANGHRREAVDVDGPKGGLLLQSQASLEQLLLQNNAREALSARGEPVERLGWRPQVSVRWAQVQDTVTRLEPAVGVFALSADLNVTDSILAGNEGFDAYALRRGRLHLQNVVVQSRHNARSAYGIGAQFDSNLVLTGVDMSTERPRGIDLNIGSHLDACGLRLEGATDIGIDSNGASGRSSLRSVEIRQSGGVCISAQSSSVDARNLRLEGCTVGIVEAPCMQVGPAEQITFVDTEVDRRTFELVGETCRTDDNSDDVERARQSPEGP